MELLCMKLEFLPSIKEKFLFQRPVFSGLVWPKVGRLSLHTCCCQMFVNLKQILWSSIFHVCRKSTHGFTRTHRQQGALCLHAILQILYSFQLNHISQCKVYRSWMSHGFLMLWGILWVYKQQVDYVHLHTDRFSFFSPYLWEIWLLFFTWTSVQSKYNSWPVMRKGCRIFHCN